MILKYVVAHAVTTPPPDALAELFSNWPESDRRSFDETCRTQAEGIIATMNSLGLWKHTSPFERAFLQSYGSTMETYSRMAAGWRLECVGAICWALGILDEFPRIDAECSTDLLASIPLKKVGLFSRCPSLRGKQEIAKMRDQMEFWHWRVRTRRLIEEGHSLPSNDDLKAAGMETYDDIVRVSAKLGYEKGSLSEILDEDFVFLGKPFRTLSSEEYQNATSIIMERHYALNWLCGHAPGNRWDDTPTDT